MPGGWFVLIHLRVMLGVTFYARWVVRTYSPASHAWCTAVIVHSCVMKKNSRYLTFNNKF